MTQMDKLQLYASTIGREWKVKMSRIARQFTCPACKAGPDIKCDTLFIAPGRATCDARIFAAADAEVIRLSNPPPESTKRLSGWSDGDDAYLWEMWEGGADIHQIAGRLKRTPRAIIWRLSDHFAAITIEVRDSAGALRGVVSAPGSEVVREHTPEKSIPQVVTRQRTPEEIAAEDDYHRRLDTHGKDIR